MTSINNVRKQLQRERNSLLRQAERIGAALAALGGTNGRKTARRTFKMSLAARKRISAGRRKQLAAKKK